MVEQMTSGSSEGSPKVWFQLVRSRGGRDMLYIVRNYPSIHCVCCQNQFACNLHDVERGLVLAPHVVTPLMSRACFSTILGV